MNDEEKAEMLSDVTLQVCKQLESCMKNIKKYFDTYPELHDYINVVIDVSFADDNVGILGAMVGQQKSLLKRIKSLKKEVANG